MNSITSILYITILITSYNALSMNYGLNHRMTEEEVQATLQHINFHDETVSHHKTAENQFPHLSDKEKAEKTRLINLGLQLVLPKDQDQYFQDVTNLYLQHLSKSNPLPQITKKEFKQNLLRRRHSG